MTPLERSAMWSARRDVFYDVLPVLVVLAMIAAAVFFGTGHDAPSHWPLG